MKDWDALEALLSHALVDTVPSSSMMEAVAVPRPALTDAATTGACGLEGAWY